MTAARSGALSGTRRNTPPGLRLHRQLFVNEWILSLFGVDEFEDLAKHLRDESLEGLDEDNIHRFHRALCAHLPAAHRPELTDDVLLAYDQEIVSVSRRLNARRDRPIVWKYFQYLALLFTEIYLDRWFRDPEGLLLELNGRIATFNEHVPASEQVAPFDPDGNAAGQLNQLAYWMATGSGKTLLMHANILQYERYLERHGRLRERNRIILITPNPGLSRQHLQEFVASDIDGRIFDKDRPVASLLGGPTVEILEVTKLGEDMGKTTVAVEALEDNNLVLVDEGHRGASAGEEGAWMTHRNALSRRGFSFEYSATFGQAVGNNRELLGAYSRSIVFDYSYSRFHNDGFGKDYQILNLEDDTDPEWLETYLVAALLTFYQQQRLYRDRTASFRPFHIEPPLWVFVGGSVTKTLANRDASDMMEIVRFLSRYVGQRQGSIARIRRVLNEGLVTGDGDNLFAGRFGYLNTKGLTAEQVFEDTLITTFNAVGGGALYVENLRGTSGEIALRIGDNEPFGVINVAEENAASLVRSLGEVGVAVGERVFAGSLFHDLGEPDSTVNVLIGSRKFTEGWNSWRVSTMGLMNIGRGEGSQIIQLFGRGVRLKGYDMSLKRSDRTGALPRGMQRPEHIGLLETLSIFGVRADYMARFRDILTEAGIPKKGGRVEIVLPVRTNLGDQPLKMIRVQRHAQGVSTEDGDAFRLLGPNPTVEPPGKGRGAERLQDHVIELNWYPKVRAIRSRDGAVDMESTLHEGRLTPEHVALLDMDALYLAVEQFKSERGWHNLNVTRSGLRRLLLDNTWYRLLIPEHELAFDTYDKVRRWHEIALVLLKTYVSRYYAHRRNEWELPRLEYRELTEADPNFFVVEEEGPVYGYRVVLDEEQEELIARLERWKEIIERGDLSRAMIEAEEKESTWTFHGVEAIFLAGHVYEPLLFVDKAPVEIVPAALNKGERRFLADLKSFCENRGSDLGDVELYLLRNQSKGRGVGFFEAGNFHPDFILWVLKGTKQHIVFIDPKGLRQLPRSDAKVQFHETVKAIERRLGDPDVSLHAFLLSETSSRELGKLWDLSKEAMESLHVLFPKEDGDYVARLIRKVLGSVK